MASTAPSADAGDDKPPEIAPGNPTGPDPHRNIEPPAPPSAPVMSSGDGGTSVTGTTEDFYPLPLWALEERACSSCAHKKMLREKWEAARGLDPLACPRSDDGVPPSSPSAPVQGPGTEPEDPQAPPATWWCDPCEQHKKSLRDWHLRREGKLRPSPPPPPPPPPSRMPYFLPVLGSTKSIVKLGRRLQEEARRGKKRPLSVAEERGYRECDVGKKVMRHKQDGPPRDTAGLGAATRVRDALTKMMPDKHRGARRVDYSKLTPLVGSREPSFSAEDLHEGSSAQRFALHVSTEFMRLLDPQVSSSAAAGGDLDGRLDEEAIDNLLNGEGMEDIFKTSIPKAYSKEILYDLIMDCVGQYQKWLLDNRDKLDKEKYEQYLQQLVPMVDLTMVYDKEPENLSKIMKLMYKVGEYGPPPSGVIHAISPRRYQSTMEQLAAAGVVDVLHDKVPQVIKVQTEWLHEGWSAQRFALQVSTEFMQLLDPHACTSSAAAGGDLDRRLDEEAIDNLLNGEGMEDIVKTSIPKAYSKEILYDLIMECVAQYRKWLSDNRDKLDKGKYEHYLKQLVPMVQLILVYDKEPENLSKIMKLMYKVGEYGPPPSGVIHAISPHLYQSTMEQLFAAGAVDVFHDKVLQVIKAQTEDLHDGCFSQRWVGQVSTEFMRLLDPDVGSGTAAGGNLDRRLDKDAIGNLLNVEGMQDIIKTSIPKVYSKDILCELFTEYVGQYPKWLEDNKDKLDKESYDQYVKQFESMVNLTTVYNDEPENFSTIMKLIYKIGEYGPPPSGVIHAISPHLYQSTMEQLSAGMIELLQQYDKLFSVDTSPSTT